MKIEKFVAFILRKIVFSSIFLNAKSVIRKIEQLTEAKTDLSIIKFIANQRTPGYKRRRSDYYK